MNKPDPLRLVQQALVALKQPKGATLKDITRYVVSECRGALGNDPKEVGKALRSVIKQGVQRKALIMARSGEIKAGHPPGLEICRRRRRRRGKSKGKKGKGRRRRRRRRRSKKGKKGRKGRRRRRRRRRRGKKGR